MRTEEDSRYLHLQEITQQEFCDHIEDEDFFRTYGNPVVINCNNGQKVVAIAWPMAERMLRMTGQADEVIRRAVEMAEDNADGAGENDIRYWIFEIEMSEEAKRIFDEICEQHELTPDELFRFALEDAIHRAKTDPEGYRKEIEEFKARVDDDCYAHLARYYPVRRNETEAQARKRKLAEEKAESSIEDKDQ